MHTSCKARGMRPIFTALLGLGLASASLYIEPSAPAHADTTPSLVGCQGPLLRCSGDEQLHFAWQQTPFTGVQVDTGWLPQNSNVQLRFGVRLTGNSRVDFEGGAGGRWNDSSMQVGLIAKDNAGLLDVGYGLQITAQLKFNVSVLGRNFQWTGNLPTPIALPNDLLLAAETNFDPWVLAGAEPVRVYDTTDRVDAFNIGLDNIGIDVPGIGGHVALQAQATLEAKYTDTRVDISGEKIGYDGEEIDYSVDVSNDEFEDELPVSIKPTGRLQYTAGVNLYPNVQLRVLGITIINQDLFSLHVDLPSVSTVVSYQEGDAFVPLPQLEMSPSELVVGDSGSTLTIENRGKATLLLEAVDWPTELQALPELIEVPAGASIDLSIVALPGTDLGAIASLAFDSNDPNHAHILVPLHEDSIEPDPAGEPAGGGADPALDAAGCGCQSTGAGSTSSGLLALLALMLFGRRQRLVRGR